MKKLAPSTLEIGTYTTDAVKIIGSCLFYLVHLETKKLQEVTFYVAQNDGSVLLSCTTTLVFGLIQPHTRLDYLPPRASFNTSSVDHLGRKRECLFTAQGRKCPLKPQRKQLQFPHWWQARSKFHKTTKMFLSVLDAFQVLPSHTFGSKYYTQADTL